MIAGGCNPFPFVSPHTNEVTCPSGKDMSQNLARKSESKLAFCGPHASSCLLMTHQPNMIPLCQIWLPTLPAFSLSLCAKSLTCRAVVWTPTLDIVSVSFSAVVSPGSTFIPPQQLACLARVAGCRAWLFAGAHSGRLQSCALHFFQLLEQGRVLILDCVCVGLLPALKMFFKERWQIRRRRWCHCL